MSEPENVINSLVIKTVDNTAVLNADLRFLFKMHEPQMGEYEQFV